jgi:formamidopyrimidine-DNA glycosylase
MPEGPELRYSRDFLRQFLIGKDITGLQRSSTGRYASKPPEGFDATTHDLPLTVESIDTHGKFMWWTLKGADGSHWYMHCTYGMSGGWFKEASRHTCFIVEAGEGKAFFNDPRHFGTIKFVSSAAAHAKKLRTLGPCIFDPGLTPEIFAKNALRKPSRTIAEALMDQSAVAGVGNYLKAEILHRSRVSPWRKVTDVSADEYLMLHTETVACAESSYRSQGATIMTYRTPDGEEGGAQFDFQVYGQKACPLGHEVRNEETPEGRTSWWCPQCQK